MRLAQTDSLVLSRDEIRKILRLGDCDVITNVLWNADKTLTFIVSRPSENIEIG